MVVAVVAILILGAYCGPIGATPPVPQPLFPYIAEQVFEPDEGGRDSLVRVIYTPEQFNKLVLKSPSSVLVKFFARPAKQSIEHKAWIAKIAQQYENRLRVCAVDVSAHEVLPLRLGAILNGMYHRLLAHTASSYFIDQVRSMLRMLAAVREKKYDACKPFYLVAADGQLILMRNFGPESQGAVQMIKKYAHEAMQPAAVGVEIAQSGSNDLGQLAEAIVTDREVPRGSFLQVQLPDGIIGTKKLGLL